MEFLSRSFSGMIRSSKLSFSSANTGRRSQIQVFNDEYQRVTGLFTDLLWDMPKIPRLIPKNLTSQISPLTWLSARVLQCTAKQASGIVRGTRAKQEKCEFIYQNLLTKGKLKQARKLKKVIDKAKVTKPDLKNVNPELDSRFVKLDWESETSFDGWVTLSSLGDGMKIQFPIKKTKHFNQLQAHGLVKQGLRLGQDSITFMFSIPKPEPKTQGDVLGIDIGFTRIFSTSSGLQSQPDRHGHTLPKIVEKMNRKQKRSKGFKKAQDHRTNYVNWSLNQLDLTGTKILKLENIRNLRLGKKTSKAMRSWTYPSIFGKLERLCEETGVQIQRVEPAFTSQRCSCCGWVQKANRKGVLFKCKSCGHTADADLNAARNISFSLAPLGAGWRKLPNRTGFYWGVQKDQELIVPDTQRTSNVDKCLRCP